MSCKKMLRWFRENFTAGCLHISGFQTSTLPHTEEWMCVGKKELPLLPLYFPPPLFLYSIGGPTPCALFFLPLTRSTFRNLAGSCSLRPLDFSPLFHLPLPISLALCISLFLHPSQQTFSNSLSCKLGCLSSFISKHVSLPLCLLYLPIQPTLGLNQACSLCVKNKSSSAHFRVKWDYLAAAFIPFLPPFLVLHSWPVVFCGIKVLGWEEKSEEILKRRGPGAVTFCGKWVTGWIWSWSWSWSWNVLFASVNVCFCLSLSVTKAW